LLSLKTDSQLIPTTAPALRTAYINLSTNNQKHQQCIATFNKQTHAWTWSKN